MPSVNKIKLNICATDYVLTTDEPDSYMRELGGEGITTCGCCWTAIPASPPPWLR